jgi:hypothetical protein
LDRQRVAPMNGSSRSAILNLTRGSHTLTVAIDVARRRDGIRCVLEDVPDSPARAQPVLGK